MNIKLTKIAKVFSIAFLISYTVLGQGGVDVKFIPADSIGSAFINRKVKLDFLTSDLTLSARERQRFYDTITLDIDNRPVEFVEIKGQGTDHYYFEDEYLQAETYKPGQVLRIYDCAIKEINDTSIRFEMTLQIYEESRKKHAVIDRRDRRKIIIYPRVGNERHFILSKSKIMNIWIPKARLDGVLIRTL